MVELVNLPIVQATKESDYFFLLENPKDPHVLLGMVEVLGST